MSFSHVGYYKYSAVLWMHTPTGVRLCTCVLRFVLGPVSSPLTCTVASFFSVPLKDSSKHLLSNE